MRNRICQADLRFLALIATIAIPNPSHRCPGLEQAMLHSLVPHKTSVSTQTDCFSALPRLCVHP